jgi:hypothetical protein
MTRDECMGCNHDLLTLQEHGGQFRWVRNDGKVTTKSVSDASRLTFYGYDLDLWADDCRHCCTNLRIVLGDPSRKGFVGIIERSEDRPDAIEYRYVLAKPGNPPVYVPRDGEEADSFEEEQAWLVWQMMMIGEPRDTSMRPT